MSETNRLMTEDERAEYNKRLLWQLNTLAGIARMASYDLAADWLKWHIDLMEIEGGD